jgi:hypothetical protein
MVAHELTFYLAAVVLVMLTAESCIKLLHRDSFGITVAVYVTVFAWYFVDPFIDLIYVAARLPRLLACD